ncbi:DUF948 domain-containing protein [Culicoidibacter larvae]|uniref:DUF948 domain-containing protein n=1 Tax=Culicoidibacter larvae TaxID=2579976 RepID=A0A5R8QFY6_9FIRM|nr:DUF948 domain-containing protein [Culicoidibacter larvae]TLG76666.1 DUF948 domain-containing protein [Culicoidibacter larvae]
MNNITIDLNTIFWVLIIAILFVAIILLVYLIRFLRMLFTTIKEANKAIQKVQTLVDDTNKVMKETYEITARANSSYKKVNTLVDALTTAVGGFVSAKLRRK